jgi:TolB-like protein/Tfp pilus assembly protein PilF
MLKKFLTDLRRRDVYKVGAAYVVIAWAVLEAGALIFDTLDVPEWSTRLLLGMLALGFPIALLLAWVYKVDSRGIRLETETDLPADADNAVASSGSAALPDDLSIAVLSFEDLSADHAQEYIGDGIAEEILNLLARVPELRVIARTSSFAFKGRDLTATGIARELHVAYILEGSIRQSGDTLRVTAQLIRARDDSHLFSDSYDLPMKNLLRLQDDIARKVTRKLQVTLLQPEHRAMAEGGSVSHDLYLQGTHLLWQGSLQGLRQAIDVLSRAIEVDPEHANAHALLAYAYMLLCADPQADRRLESALPQIETHANRAMALDPDSEQANLSMAMFQMAVKNWKDSERYFLRAISINPSYSRAAGYYAYFLANTRRMEEGMFWANRAVAVDPLNAHELIRQAQLASYTGDQEAALDSARKALELQPGFGTAYIWLVGIYGQLGQHEHAIEAMCRWNLVDLRLNAKEEEEFNRILREDGVPGYLQHWYSWLKKKRERGARSPHLPWFLGLYAILSGHSEEALDYLEEAWTQTLLVPDLVFFTALHDNPRWQSLLERYQLTDPEVDELRRLSRSYRMELGIKTPY